MLLLRCCCRCVVVSHFKFELERRLCCRRGKKANKRCVCLCVGDEEGEKKEREGDSGPFCFYAPVLPKTCLCFNLIYPHGFLSHSPTLSPSLLFLLLLPCVCFFAGCFSIGIRARSFNFIAVIPILVGFDYAQTHSHTHTRVCLRLCALGIDILVRFLLKFKYFSFYCARFAHRDDNNNNNNESVGNISNPTFP